MGFSVQWYGKTRTNFLVNAIYRSLDLHKTVKSSRNEMFQLINEEGMIQLEYHNFKIIYLFLAASGLSCGGRALCCGMWDPERVGSVVAALGLSSCGSRV